MDKKLIIVIGRGSGGTRLISSTLSGSGVYMGSVNNSGDMVPAEPMYAAVKMAGRLINISGVCTWDFSELLKTPAPTHFKDLVKQYTADIMLSTSDVIGWKLPETLLAFPWIIEMFPNAYFIHWIRDPRDTVATKHITDKLEAFDIPCNEINITKITSIKPYEKGIESYCYQREIVMHTPAPYRFLEVKFEDFVLNQNVTLEKISQFLDMPLIKVPVDKTKIGRFRHTINVKTELLKKYGYL